MNLIYLARIKDTFHSGVYCGKECCSQYHGANRLGGNSTLGAIYGGNIAAKNAVKEKLLEQKVLEKAEEKACGLISQMKKMDSSKDSSEAWLRCRQISKSVQKEIHIVLSIRLRVFKRRKDSVKNIEKTE